MQQPRVWVRKLAYWLPYHEDLYVHRLAEAAQGQFTPRFKPDGDSDAEPNPEAKLSAFDRSLAELKRRAEPMLARLRPGKHRY
jgi:hypothetical protein